MNRNTKYVGYFLRVPYDDYPAAFDKALKKMFGHKEVDEIRLVQLRFVPLTVCVRVVLGH